MNYATLGPEIPRIASDPAAVRLLRWAVVAHQNQNGNVIATFKIADRDRSRGGSAVLLLAIEPYSLTLQRCMRIDELDQQGIALDRVPSMLIDLAVTKVRELYHAGFPQGWSPH